MGKQQVKIDYKRLRELAKQMAQDKPTKHGGRGRPTENQVVGTERRN